MILRNWPLDVLPSWRDTTTMYMRHQMARGTHSTNCLIVGGVASAQCVTNNPGIHGLRFWDQQKVSCWYKEEDTRREIHRNSRGNCYFHHSSSCCWDVLLISKCSQARFSHSQGGTRSQSKYWPRPYQKNKRSSVWILLLSLTQMVMDNCTFIIMIHILELDGPLPQVLMYCWKARQHKRLN